MKNKRCSDIGILLNFGETHRRNEFRESARALVCLAILAVATPAWLQQKSTDLANQSLEHFMNVEVTFVSKREQKLSQVAAAVFVITKDDIRYSGAAKN